MSFLDALIHLSNFFLPALGLGAIAASLVKLLWWRSLRPVSWIRLVAAAVLACAAALVAGLALAGGRDGKMLTYLLMVLGSALALWWVGLRRV